MDQSQLVPTKGKIFGAILLVAGCCIGAGMLGLPVLSAETGFKPSLLMFLVCWLFMLTTSFLLLEVNLWLKGDVSIISMAEHSLGRVGKAVTWVVYLYLFYCLMVAYAAGSGALVADFTSELIGIKAPYWVGSLMISLLFGLLIYTGTHAVDRFNRLLMGGLIVAYLGLVFMGARYVNADYLARHDWAQVGGVIPIMVISFGYHNLIPSLSTYLKYDVKSLKQAFFFGSLIPLFAYLVWEWLILGIVPFEGKGGFKEALDEGQMATEALRSTIGSSWVLTFAESFAFFAIITSFLGVALSFVDFLADGFKIKKTIRGKAVLCLMAILPPFVSAIAFPSIFLVALNYAGGFGAVILFGILPALMVWKGRYEKKIDMPHLVPGGKVVLSLVILFAVGVMILTAIK